MSLSTERVKFNWRLPRLIIISDSAKRLNIYLAETSIFFGRNVHLSWPNRPCFWPKRPCFLWPKRIMAETSCNPIWGAFVGFPWAIPRGSEKHASLENTLVRFKPVQRNVIIFFVNSWLQYMFMIKIKCANNTIIELHDLHKSFVS